MLTPSSTRATLLLRGIRTTHRISQGTGFAKFRAYLVPGLLLALIIGGIHLSAYVLPPGLANLASSCCCVAPRQVEIL